ncbi:MAG: T9SS type A sorting domain-containing protein, partial [Bacteroidota bacterium]|nr:T9SS type A sorting domain-containing protein [Bacteroidota bacterium]
LFPFAGSFTPRIFNGVVNYCPSGSQPCEAASTLYAGGNGNDGSMFDVTSAVDISVTRFSVNMNGTGFMKIYYHTGTYVGTLSTPGAWTLLDSALVASVGANTPTILPILSSVNIAAGQTMAFYITGNGSGASLNYTNGTAVGNVYTNDGIVSIREGSGLGYPFAGPGASPRIWNGTIDYCVATGIGSEVSAGQVQSSIYPNPVNNEATLLIDFVNQPENVSVQITDIAGRTIQMYPNVIGNQVKIDATGMPAGLYFYTIYSGVNQTGTGKFIVE